jgi:hypothetical protein
MIQSVLKLCHNTPLAGHRGIRKTTNSIQKQFFWDGLANEIKEFCSKCIPCLKMKLKNPAPVPLTKFNELQHPMQRVALDIVGPMHMTSSGNRYIMTCQDTFTRYPEAKAIPDQTAETVAKGFIELIVTRYGAPEVLLTDRGRNFTSSLMRRVCSLLQVPQIYTSPYHAAGNSHLERSHKEFSSVIAQFISEENEWDQWISSALFVYRTTVHSALKETPSMMMFGREVTVPWADIFKPSRINYAIDNDYAEELKQRLRIVHEKAIV